MALSIPSISISYFQNTCLKVCTRCSCQYQAYSTARLLTEQGEVFPSFPMLHTAAQKQKLKTTSLPYTCTKIKYENTADNDCNIFVLNQIVTYALYTLFSLSLHLGLEPVKL